jgi:hypothetical protein
MSRNNLVARSLGKTAARCAQFCRHTFTMRFNFVKQEIAPLARGNQNPPDEREP